MTPPSPAAAGRPSDGSSPGTRDLLATLAELLDGLNVALCVFDDADCTVLWNRSFLRLFPEHAGHIQEGEPYHANLQRFYAARLGPDELPRLEAYVAAGVARHRAQTRPFEFEHRGLRIRVASLSLGPFGRVRAWRAEASPVPAERQVPLSDGLATEGPTAGALLLDRVPDGLMVCDRAGAIQWVNDAFIATYGLPERATALGVPFEVVYRQAWATGSGDETSRRDDGLAVLQENLRLSGAPFELPLPGRRWVRVVARPADDGTAFYAHVDISELKAQQDVLARAEADLRASQRKYRTLTESMKDVVWVLDAESLRFTYMSPSVEKLRGYTPAEIMAEPMDAALTSESRAVVRASMAERVGECRAGRLAPTTFFTNDVEQPCRDGSTVWTEVISYFQLDAETGRVEVYGVTRDISERKRLEQALTTANEQLAAASAAKTEFLAHMSHEIRTPLNAVLGLAQVLGKMVADPEHRDIVQRIQAAGVLLLNQLNDILDLSKIEAGKLALESRPFRLATVLSGLDDLMGAQALAKGLTLRIDAADAIDLPLIGDAARLEQTLLNLISNAIKFSARGEILLRVAVLQRESAAVRLRFEVRDPGIGIAADKLDRLFLPFSQADTGIARRYGGSGLGLAICKRLVERMGGVIGVDSAEGVGSSFWLELPFEYGPSGEGGPDHDAAAGRADPGANAAPAPVDPAIGARLAGLRLLVVDDSPMNLDLMERVLKREGATVTLASDGQQALVRLDAIPAGFDGVLMDVQMPVMDGLTATRAIRARPALAGLPVIAVSAGAYPEDRQQALAAGADGFVTKPIDVAGLVGVIVRTIARRATDRDGAGDARR